MHLASLGLIGILLGLGVGGVLGLLGGGGSILALPIFLYVFHAEPRSAIAMSLAVVGASAAVGFLGHWRQGTVHLRIALPFGACAMVGAFVAARLSHFVPTPARLALFVLFSATASILMLRDSLRTPVRTALRDGESAGGDDRPSSPRFSPVLGLEGVGVGALTAIIGAGGGFVIVPALVLMGGVPVREAVGSSLLIIAMNSLTGFVGNLGRVPISWSLVIPFTVCTALGVMVGTRLVPYVPQRRLKQGFAVLILVLGAYLVGRALQERPAPPPAPHSPA